MIATAATSTKPDRNRAASTSTKNQAHQLKPTAGVIQWTSKGRHHSDQQVVSCTNAQWSELVRRYPEMGRYGVVRMANGNVIAVSPVSDVGAFAIEALTA